MKLAHLEPVKVSLNLIKTVYTDIVHTYTHAHTNMYLFAHIPNKILAIESNSVLKDYIHTPGKVYFRNIKMAVFMKLASMSLY